MTDHKNKEVYYPLRLDFYWRAISLYLIAAIIYAFVKGAFEIGSITIQLKDPVIILLSIFIVISGVSLFFSWYAQREIIIGENYLEFKNRFRSKRIEGKNIVSIVFGREVISKGGRTRRLPIRIVKIKLKDESRIIKFRISTYQDSKKLLEDILKLKQRLF